MLFMSRWSRACLGYSLFDGRCITNIKEQRCYGLAKLLLQAFCITLFSDAAKDVEVLLDEEPHDTQPDAGRCSSDNNAFLSKLGSHLRTCNDSKRNVEAIKAFHATGHSLSTSNVTINKGQPCRAIAAIASDATSNALMTVHCLTSDLHCGRWMMGVSRRFGPRKAPHELIRHVTFRVNLTFRNASARGLWHGLDTEWSL